MQVAGGWQMEATTTERGNWHSNQTSKSQHSCGLYVYIDPALYNSFPLTFCLHCCYCTQPLLIVSVPVFI